MVWKVNTDGGCRDNPGPGAWAFVINKGDGDVEELAGFLPHGTNNCAEYRGFEAACITILQKDASILPDAIEIFSDSQLIVNQINGVFKVNDSVRPYHTTALAAFKKLQAVCPTSLSWVRREFNSGPDALCNKKMDQHGIVCSKKGKKRDEVFV